MINASSEFREKINKGTYVVNYADITLRNGTVLNLSPEDFVLGAFSMQDDTTDGKFGVGYAIGKTISLTIANHTEKYSAYDFYKSMIHIYVAVAMEDGRVLRERKGKYYVINPASPGDVITLSGVDSMHLFDREYAAKTAYPATLQRILSDCCLECGVRIGFKQFEQYNFTVQKRPEGVTYREVVSYVAQIAGKNARINNDDALELVWYDTKLLDYVNIDGGNLINYATGVTYDGGNFSDYATGDLLDGGYFNDPAPENIWKVKNLKVSTDNVVISGVRVSYDDVSVIKGTKDYLIEIKDNPFVEGKENEVCSYLSDKLTGLTFRPLTCEITNNPLYEPYDVAIIFDRKGNAYHTLINSVSYKNNGFTTISCKADDPIRNESSYASEAAKATVQNRRNTQKQLSEYDLVVQNMNQLAANAMGIFRETEELPDKSVVYYMSNRPITKDDSGKCSFAKNAVVYKMTGDGFFVSNDGGISYTSGFDSNGNAVLNVLSAIGITFDWAKGGTLTLGGSGNVNGSMDVLDSSGNVIGRFNKDGLWASNGYFEGTIKSQNAEITGGTINIETDDEDYSIIKLSYKNSYLKISPRGIVVNGDKGLLLTADGIHFGPTNSGRFSALDPDSLLLSNKNTGDVIIVSPMEFTSTGDVKVGKSSSRLGFFGKPGGTKQRVSTMDFSSNITPNDVASKINEIIYALSAYGLIDYY